MEEGPRPSERIAHTGESERERLNRNMNELLQELRVSQTGVQILFAFLLALPFAQRFNQVTRFQRDAARRRVRRVLHRPRVRTSVAVQAQGQRAPDQ